MLAPYLNKKNIEAGCDEAGRGCLAGPVFAAAVILPKNFKSKILTDSKLVDEATRYELRELVKEKSIAWAVAHVKPHEIDRINILNASFLAMHRAIKKLEVQPNSLLIDGNRFNPYKKIEHHCIIKGDSKYFSIAAASILAKTYRDDYMKRKAKKFPQYSWTSNKGYPTIAHRKAIKEFGPTEMHRRSFKLLPDPVQGVLFEKWD